MSKMRHLGDFQADLETEGVFYPKTEYNVRKQRTVAMRTPFPCELQNGRYDW